MVLKLKFIIKIENKNKINDDLYYNLFMNQIKYSFCKVRLLLQ